MDCECYLTKEFREKSAQALRIVKAIAIVKSSDTNALFPSDDVIALSFTDSFSRSSERLFRQMLQTTILDTQAISTFSDDVIKGLQAESTLCNYRVTLLNPFHPLTPSDSPCDERDPQVVVPPFGKHVSH